MKDSENIFGDYKIWIRDDNGKIIDTNKSAFIEENIESSFELFKSLYDEHYGSIEINDNLISIHTGGWSENEYLIGEFMETLWWKKYHKITAVGGHYFFNTDFCSEKEWKIVSTDSVKK